MVNYLNQKVYIILVNYCEYESTIRCVSSILESNYPYFDILIVDNNSPNESYNALYEHFSKKPLIKHVLPENYQINESYNNLVIINSNKNLGFAGGCNVATRLVTKSENKNGYIWYLNNDTIVSKNTLKSFFDVCTTNRRTIYGSTLIASNTNKVQCYGGGSINGFFGYQKLVGMGDVYEPIKYNDQFQKRVNRNLNYISGASLFLNVELVSKFGMMREDFFLYWEETDFCYHLQKKGVKLEWVPQSIVYHEIGKSTDLTSPMTDYFSTRNSIIFFKEHYPRTFVMTIFSNLILKILNRFKRKQFHRINLVIKAIIDAITY